jgi:hypothetical protein
MPALPAQRAVQRPVQAAMASQRALGRAAQGVAEPVTPIGVAWINGQWYDVDLTAEGTTVLVPRGPVPVVPAPPADLPQGQGDGQDHDHEQPPTG